MTTTTTSVLHRSLRLGVGFLIAGAVLAACGNSDQVSSGPGLAPPAAPAAAYVSPEQADREAMLALRNASDDIVDRSAKLDLGSALAREAIARRDADAAIDRSAKLDLGSALARRATVGQSSASASADALERHALAERTSAHRSADALEHWALSDSGS